jgi:hypothetical protein
MVISMTMAMGQWGNGNDRSIVPIAIIDRVDVGCGAWVSFIPCVAFEKVSEWQKEVQISFVRSLPSLGTFFSKCVGAIK